MKDNLDVKAWRYSVLIEAVVSRSIGSDAARCSMSNYFFDDVHAMSREGGSLSWRTVFRDF